MNYYDLTVTSLAWWVYIWETIPKWPLFRLLSGQCFISFIIIHPEFARWDYQRFFSMKNMKLQCVVHHFKQQLDINWINTHGITEMMKATMGFDPPHFIATACWNPSSVCSLYLILSHSISLYIYIYHYTYIYIIIYHYIYIHISYYILLYLIISYYILLYFVVS